MENLEIVVVRDAADLARRAAELFAGIASEAAAEYRTLAVALAGGSTPKALYELLASDEYHGAIDWPLVHFFWGDERYVPPDSPDSNYRMAYDALLSKVPVPSANIHRMPTESADEDAAASAVERALLDHFKPAPGDLPRFDLVLLGLGDDGHTASLFPRMPTLNERERLVVATPPGRLPPPVDRLTLTLPVLNAAARVVFLVAGGGKAEVVHRVLGEPPENPPLPARLVQPADGRLTWMLDEAAAGQLPR